MLGYCHEDFSEVAKIFNHNFSKYEDNNLPLSVVAKDILRSYKVGLKTLYYANTDDGKTDNAPEESDCPGGACKL